MYTFANVATAEVPHVIIRKDGTDIMAVYITEAMPVAQAEELATKVVEFLNRPAEAAAA